MLMKESKGYREEKSFKRPSIQVSHLLSFIPSILRLSLTLQSKATHHLMRQPVSLLEG